MITAARAADVSLARFVARHAAHRPDSPALVYDGGDLTYARLEAEVAATAAALAERGVGRGDRVAYLGMNSGTFLVTLFASSRLGAIFVPLNFRLAAPEVADILGLSEPVVIVSEEGHRAVVEAAGATSARHHLLVDDDPAIPVGNEHDDRWVMLSDAKASAGLVPDPVAIGFDDVAVLMFTSGTTGRPKGVILTAGNVWWNGLNVDSVVDTRRDDVTLAVAPLFHIGGLNAFTVRTLTRGGTVVLRREFDPVRTVHDLAEHRVNTFFAVPAMFAALARTEGFFDQDLSALRSAVVAAAPVPPSLIVEYADRGVLLQQAWGLTETAPFASYLPPELTRTKTGSAGLPMPFTEVAIVDVADGRTELLRGQSGEVVVRGPNVTPGYWQNEAANRIAFDDEGWFHTGDVGYLDDDGCLFIVDRLKDMIITGGENVYPAEVESALADLTGVLDVAVVGAKHPTWGETVVAVVATAAGSDVTLDDVRAHAERSLARYKLPTELRVVEVVPRNASGKLDKIAIRSLLQDGS